MLQADISIFVAHNNYNSPPQNKTTFFYCTKPLKLNFSTYMSIPKIKHMYAN